MLQRYIVLNVLLEIKQHAYVNRVQRFDPVESFSGTHAIMFGVIIYISWFQCKVTYLLLDQFIVVKLHSVLALGKSYALFAFFLPLHLQTDKINKQKLFLGHSNKRLISG